MFGDPPVSLSSPGLQASSTIPGLFCSFPNVFLPFETGSHYSTAWLSTYHVAVDALELSLSASSTVQVLGVASNVAGWRCPATGIICCRWLGCPCIVDYVGSALATMSGLGGLLRTFV